MANNTRVQYAVSNWNKIIVTEIIIEKHLITQKTSALTGKMKKEIPSQEY